MLPILLLSKINNLKNASTWSSRPGNKVSLTSTMSMSCQTSIDRPLFQDKSESLHKQLLDSLDGKLERLLFRMEEEVEETN